MRAASRNETEFTTCARELHDAMTSILFRGIFFIGNIPRNQASFTDRLGASELYKSIYEINGRVFLCCNFEVTVAAKNGPNVSASGIAL